MTEQYTIPATMRALQVPTLDGPQAMRLVEVPVPRPDADEVLVRVTAAGVSFADTMQTRGTDPHGPTAPYLAGTEAVGQIAALGAEVEGWQVGARVLGVGPGAFAGYIILPTAALVPVPEGWTDTQTVGLHTSWMTAYAALCTFGALREGETVLVHAAASGVGQAVVRLAKHFGARVIATTSTDANAKVALAIGADDVIDYVEYDVAEHALALTDGRGVDLILDGVGGEVFRANLRAAVPGGRVIVYGVAAADASVTNRELLFEYPVSVIGLNLTVLGACRPDLFDVALDDLMSLVAQGVITPVEPEAYDLAEGPKVLAEMEQRHTTGKIVLVP